MDEPLILCPIKETMVYPSTCKKCTYTDEQCEAARTALKEQSRHCLDCKHYGKVQPCKTCMNADPRERLFWEPKAPVPEGTMETHRAIKGDAKKARAKSPTQFSLFE